MHRDGLSRWFPPSGVTTETVTHPPRARITMSISVPPSSATAARPDEGPCPSSGPSPRRLVWLRFRRDRSGVVAAVVVLCYILVALCAPIISSLYGKDPYTHYGQERPELLNEFGFPAGPH